MADRTLEETPTWALATVCFILIFISIFLEHLIHLLSKYLHRKRRPSLIQALDNIKSELMLLGFISLLLTVSEKRIANICIPNGYVTLPLYALVTQMGTSMRLVVFPENVIKGLKRWRATARKNLVLREPYSTRPSPDVLVDTSLESSPSHYSLDISVNPSFRNSPSFNTLDVSKAEDFDHWPLHHGSFEVVDVAGDEIPNTTNTHGDQVKKGSFDGFITSSTV